MHIFWNIENILPTKINVTYTLTFLDGNIINGYIPGVTINDRSANITLGSEYSLTGGYFTATITAHDSQGSISVKCPAFNFKEICKRMIVINQ